MTYTGAIIILRWSTSRIIWFFDANFKTASNFFCNFSPWCILYNAPKTTASISSLTNKGRDTLRPNFNKWPEEPFFSPISRSLVKIWFENPRGLCWQNDGNCCEEFWMSNALKMHWSPAFFPKNSISETTCILCLRAFRYIFAVNICLAPLYLCCTFNLHSLWIANVLMGSRNVKEWRMLCWCTGSDFLFEMQWSSAFSHQYSTSETTRILHLRTSRLLLVPTYL